MFDAVINRIASASTVTSDAMLVSQGVFRIVLLQQHAWVHFKVVNIHVGTAEFVHQFPSVMDNYEPTRPTCRMEIGEKKMLRLWSRGHLFIVRPCGHIDLWRPIYR